MSNGTEQTQEIERQPEPTPSATDFIVEAWFAETFFNIGLETPLYNRFRLAADALKARLAAVQE